MPIWLLKKTCTVGARSRPIILAENLVFLNLLMMLELLFSNHIIYNYSFKPFFVSISLSFSPSSTSYFFQLFICQMHDVFKHANLSVWGRLNHNPSCCYLFLIIYFTCRLLLIMQINFLNLINIMSEVVCETNMNYNCSID